MCVLTKAQRVVGEERGGGVKRVCARAHWYSSDSWHLSSCVDDTHVFVNDTCVCMCMQLYACVCVMKHVCVCVQASYTYVSVYGTCVCIYGTCVCS